MPNTKLELGGSIALSAFRPAPPTHLAYAYKARVQLSFQLSALLLSLEFTLSVLGSPHLGGGIHTDSVNLYPSQLTGMAVCGGHTCVFFSIHTPKKPVVPHSASPHYKHIKDSSTFSPLQRIVTFFLKIIIASFDMGPNAQM